MNDIQRLLERAKNGDQEAFSLVYTEYYGPVYRYIFMRVKDRDLAEDLTQDVFFKIYKSIDSFIVSEGSPIGYFFTTARNTLIDFWRKKRPDTDPEDELYKELPDPEPTPDTAAIMNEERILLEECMKKLTPDQREVLTLRYLNDMSNQEIAEITGKAETAVRQLQVRGLRTLGKLFTQKYR